MTRQEAEKLSDDELMKEGTFYSYAGYASMGEQKNEFWAISKMLREIMKERGLIGFNKKRE